MDGCKLLGARMLDVKMIPSLSTQTAQKSTRIQELGFHLRRLLWAHVKLCQRQISVHGQGMVEVTDLIQILCRGLKLLQIESRPHASVFFKWCAREFVGFASSISGLTGIELGPSHPWNWLNIVRICQLSRLVADVSGGSDGFCDGVEFASWVFLRHLWLNLRPYERVAQKERAENPRRNPRAKFTPRSRWNMSKCTTMEVVRAYARHSCIACQGQCVLCCVLNTMCFYVQQRDLHSLRASASFLGSLRPKRLASSNQCHGRWTASSFSKEEGEAQRSQKLHKPATWLLTKLANQFV